jgi:hypothetical protein
MSKFKLVYNATSGEADEVKAILHASDALASTSNALHVLLQNASIAVTATDLDIRNLTNVDVVTAEQGTSPWVVSASDLDIRDLAFASDSVDVSGSSVSITGTVATQEAAPATLDTLSKAVTTSSALLYTSPSNQKVVKIQNNGSVAIAVGPSGVTYSGTPATDGYIIAAGDAESFAISEGTAIHAVSKSGTQDVRVCSIAS